MDETRMELTPFVTTDHRANRPRWADAHSYQRTGSRRVRARSMWMKIGICLLILGAVIASEVLLLSGGETVETAAAGDQEDGGDGDVLGRLRFVEAGGVRSVFKVAQRWTLPVSAKTTELLEDDTLLCLVTEPGARIAVSASGEVTAVGFSEEYGAYARVSHGSDLESYYYNLTDVTVEEGQPLLAGDTLGAAALDGRLYVRILRAGTPVNPTDFLDTDGAA